MEIKEAVRIIKETDESEMESLSNAILIEKAETKIMDCIKNGYTLCKADEAAEKMENAKFDSTEKFCCAFNDGLSTAIEILKEVCE